MALEIRLRNTVFIMSSSAKISNFPSIRLISSISFALAIALNSETTCLVSGLALARYDARTSGLAPANRLDVFLDEHFDNARMERVYPNAKKT